jgi:hypothetical protein
MKSHWSWLAACLFFDFLSVILLKTTAGLWCLLLGAFFAGGLLRDITR